MRNTQIVHIAVEIVLIISLSIFFYMHTKKLDAKIEELSKKVKDQEDTIKKQAELMTKLIDLVNIKSGIQPQKQAPFINSQQLPQQLPQQQPPHQPFQQPHQQPQPFQQPQPQPQPQHRQQIPVQMMHIPMQMGNPMNISMSTEPEIFTTTSQIFKNPDEPVVKNNRVVEIIEEEEDDDDIDDEIADELKELENEE